MHIVHVDIHVREEFIEVFREATIDNASNSIQEAGILRFDFIQQVDDPTHFVLVEVYRQESDTVKHKETAHYARWRDAVETMLVAPRTRIVYHNIYPDDQTWG